MASCQARYPGTLDLTRPFLVLAIGLPTVVEAVSVWDLILGLAETMNKSKVIPKTRSPGDLTTGQ